jgi:hypothetical protein
VTAAQELATDTTPETDTEPLWPASTLVMLHTTLTVTPVVTFGVMLNVAEPRQFSPVDAIAVSVIV